MDEASARVVLHVDCDEFFLQVHARGDARIAAEVNGRACALVQYNDVICANAAAKAAGVKKHQSPAEVRRKLAPDGRLLHAYWRKWPGPRVSYQPYQAHILNAPSRFVNARLFVREEFPVTCTFPGRQTGYWSGRLLRPGAVSGAMQSTAQLQQLRNAMKKDPNAYTD